MMSTSNWFERAFADLPAPDGAAAAAVAARASSVLRPTGALQRLDVLAAHVAAWHRHDRPAVDRPGVLVFAADHGIATAGVSAYPAEVTTAMLAAVRAGSATINAIARSVGAVLEVVDVGVGDPTADIRTAPAMTTERFEATADAAAAAVDRLADDGTDLLVVGELGIGNTTVAAAVSAALLGRDGDGFDVWVGRGTGVDDEGLARKRSAVATAVGRLGDGIVDPIEVLRHVGGAELVAMAAAVVRARQRSLPVVLDGYVATAAVLAVHLARPGALDHCIAGHVSAEPGHRLLLDRLGLDPLLDLGMRLGEGSGALAAVPLVRLACTCVTEVPTFDEWFGSDA